jgi:hypothetical protein
VKHKKRCRDTYLASIEQNPLVCLTDAIGGQLSAQNVELLVLGITVVGLGSEAHPAVVGGEDTGQSLSEGNHGHTGLGGECELTQPSTRRRVHAHALLDFGGVVVVVGVAHSPSQ